MNARNTELRLKAQEDRRLSQGHCWVYSNEIASDPPLKQFAVGDVVPLVSHSGKKLGLVMVNPNALLCARLISRDPNAVWGPRLVESHIRRALALRQKFYERPFYRLCFGDSDALPGLVVDRFGDYLVVQISTAAMEGAKTWVLDALQRVLNPRSILVKNDSASRSLEALPEYVEVHGQDWPDQIEVYEGDLCLLIDPRHGQKTGWFYDHAENRRWLAGLVDNARVLDVFSYLGAWSMLALQHGARSLCAIDASQSALDALQSEAKRLGWLDRVVIRQGDAFARLAELRDQGERFDVVVLDPPALIKRRKDHKNGLNGYRRLNELAIRLVQPGGILVSCSCSMHLSREEHRDLVRAVARHADRDARIIYQGHQGADHPVIPAVPETEYLKALGVWVDMNP